MEQVRGPRSAFLGSSWEVVATPLRGRSLIAIAAGLDMYGAGASRPEGGRGGMRTAYAQPCVAQHQLRVRGGGHRPRVGAPFAGPLAKRVGLRPAGARLRHLVACRVRRGTVRVALLKSDRNTVVRCEIVHRHDGLCERDVHRRRATQLALPQPLKAVRGAALCLLLVGVLFARLRSRRPIAAFTWAIVAALTRSGSGARSHRGPLGPPPARAICIPTFSCSCSFCASLAGTSSSRAISPRPSRSRFADVVQVSERRQSVAIYELRNGR